MNPSWGEKKQNKKKNMPSPQSVIFIIYNWAHCGLKSVARLITLHARMCLRASAHDASYIWTESVWTCRSSSAGLIHLMWCTAAARGGLVSQLASNRSSNSCSKGTTVSCWLLSPLPLFYWGTVVPCCGEMSKEATELGKTIINIWQSFLKVQCICLVELKQREVSKRGEKMIGKKTFFWLSFGEGINKDWVIRSIDAINYVKNSWQFASLCLDILKWVNVLPCSVLRCSLRRREFSVSHGMPSPKKGETIGRESETEIRIGSAGDEEEIILQILSIWYSDLVAFIQRALQSTWLEYWLLTLVTVSYSCFFQFNLDGLKLIVNIYHLQMTKPHK